MVRRKLTTEKRREVRKDVRLVTMVSAKTKEQLDDAAHELDYATTSDLVREAIIEKLKKLAM